MTEFKVIASDDPASLQFSREIFRHLPVLGRARPAHGRQRVLPPHRGRLGIGEIGTQRPKVFVRRGERLDSMDLDSVYGQVGVGWALADQGDGPFRSSGSRVNCHRPLDSPTSLVRRSCSG